MQETSQNFEIINDLILHVEQVVKGKRDKIELIITCLLAKGHVLIEDNPGSGKTITARSLAAAISSGSNHNSAVFKRIQFTPDLLPMDLIGAHIFDEENKTFIFKKGPLFTNILLADEINRASPKVQSALLECMAEGQITVAETTYRLDDLFFVMATQNPIEMEGTYPLPAAQLDRFFMKIYFGYVDESSELDILNNYQGIKSNLDTLEQVITKEELLQLQNACHNIKIHPELMQSVVNIIRTTRIHPDIVVGASTRAGVALVSCLRAYAMIKGRQYAIEDDIQDIAYSVLHHRLVFRNESGKNQALEEIINQEITRLSKLKLLE